MSESTEAPANSTEEPKPPKKQITITVDEDDPCLKREEPEKIQVKYSAPDIDPRFQQQNITGRCYVMYTDFYRCQAILSEGHHACGWFKDVFSQICPEEWIERWDILRSEGRFAWHRGRSQGSFPGSKYGV